MKALIHIYFFQQWYALSDPRTKEELYDMKSMHRLTQLELSVDAVPDESNILKIHRLIKDYNLILLLFNEIKGYQKIVFNSYRCLDSS